MWVAEDEQFHVPSQGVAEPAMIPSVHSRDGPRSATEPARGLDEVGEQSPHARVAAGQLDQPVGGIGAGSGRRPIV